MRNKRIASLLLESNMGKIKNIIEELSVEASDNDKGILKGILAGGLGVAAMSDPDTAEHVKEVIHGTSNTLSDTLHNIMGDGQNGYGHTDIHNAAHDIHNAHNGAQQDLHTIIDKDGNVTYYDGNVKIDHDTYQHLINNTKNEHIGQKIGNSIGNGVSSLLNTWDKSKPYLLGAAGGVGAAGLGFAGYNYGQRRGQQQAQQQNQNQ